MVHRSTNPVMERYSEEISSGLKKFELKEDIVCYRGMNINPFVGASKNVIYEFDAFTSTSISLSGVINNTFVIEIHVPKGARGAYIKQLKVNSKAKKSSCLTKTQNI